MAKIIKTEEQIRGIRKSCSLLADIFRQLEAAVKPGVTTEELEKLANQLMQEVGGRPAFKGYRPDKLARPFPSALCTSINTEIVHAPAVPSRQLQQGDILGIDVGMELDGYYSDMARTLAVGKISQDAKKLLNITREALARGTKQMKPGNSLDDIGRAIQQHVESHGFSVVRDLVGHGVGLEVHEDPQIPHYAIAESGLPDIELRAGMVLAIEPMVNIGGWKIEVADDGFTFITADDSLSAHFENTILVTQDGHEILTAYE